MNIKKKLWALAITISLFVYQTPSEANKHSHHLPELATQWVGETDYEPYKFKAQHLRAQPLFYSFDKAYFDNHMLPTGPISFRNKPDQAVHSEQLTCEIEGLLEELRQGKKEFTNFTVLKDREFNQKEFAGLVVLKFKNYPFVLKLFAENPYSFLHPENKGFRHGCMSKMTGGLNRYLAGFSRISNLEFAQHYIETIEDLPMKLDFPRKWFWQPTNNRWFEVAGTNFADVNQPLKVELPEVYAIIADEIVCHKRLSQIKKTHGRTIFKLCQEFKFHIDPNMKNFRLEDGTQKLVLIDTEHFPTVLGFTGEISADNYLSLHIKMGLKAIYDCWIA
jgi:hypothetical protein